MICFALLLVAGLVCAKSDGKPLDPDQADALKSIYTALNCSVPTACPTLDSSRICPNLTKATHSERLTCRDGKVLALGIYDVEIGGGGSLSKVATGLKALTELRTLYIFDHDEKVTGTIPTQIGLLSELELINLSNQFITGRLPTQLGTAVSVVEIRIQGTYISGPIPTELSGLESLAHLHLDHNLLSGEVPAFPSFPSAEENVPMSPDTYQCVVLTQDFDETNCFSGCERDALLPPQLDQYGNVPADQNIAGNYD